MMQRVLHNVRRLIYAVGIRPKFWTFFYDHKLEAEEQWRTGKK